MSQKEKQDKYKCSDCGLFYWVQENEEPRFCPFCGRALLTKIGEE